MWIGLEINLLSIIPLIRRTKNIIASEAALKYFITQALASTLLLFSIIILSLNLPYNFNINLYFSLILNTSLLTKIGAAPFHFWFPEIIEGLNWNIRLIILTWQKIAPIILLTYFIKRITYLIIAIIFSLLIRGVIGLNQTRLRKILAYSSINHIGWILRTLIVIETIWSYYFIIYTIITINIVFIFKQLNIFHLKQLFTSLNYNYLVKFFFIINFLSLGGLPPFLGFLPKWLTIQRLVKRNIFIISTLLIIITLITLYFYLRITFTTLLLKTNEISYYSHNQINNTLILTFNFIALIRLLLSTVLFNFL